MLLVLKKRQFGHPSDSNDPWMIDNVNDTKTPITQASSCEKQIELKSSGMSGRWVEENIGTDLCLLSGISISGELGGDISTSSSS